MGVVFVALLALLAVEYLRRLPIVTRSGTLATIARKAVRVVSSTRISDHWKEKVLLRYARDMAVLSRAIALMLAGCIPVVVLPALALDWIFRSNPSTLQALASLPGMISMTLAASVYLAIRKRLAAV